MKRLLLVCALALSLGGCVTASQVGTALTTATVPFQNPVTKERMYALENSMIVAFAGLNAYKKTCSAGVIGAGCKDTIRALQVYTRKLPPLLRNLRALVRSGDQTNAIAVYSAAQQIISDFQSVAVANGVKVQ